MPMHTGRANVSSKTVQKRASGEVLAAARAVSEGAKRTETFPLRRAFVQVLSEDNRDSAPLRQIVSRKGGGAVPLKLFLALVWRSSAAPFTTAVPARKWAMALGLDDPNGQGARRVVVAINLLEQLSLITVERSRGEASEIMLREESGQWKGNTVYSYSLPYDAQRNKRRNAQQRGRLARLAHYYFKVPVELWTDRGDIQLMSAPALAVLLAYLNETRPDKDQYQVWWTTGAFPDRYGISTAMRTRGTAELRELGLLNVWKRSVGTPGGDTFSSHRVRNIYEASRRLKGYMDPAK